MSVSTTPPLRALLQDAIEATSTAYTDDATTDVEQRLLAELRDHGVELDDDDWVGEVARAIRSGHGVQLDETAPTGADDDPSADPSTAPGSLGGDNGGG